MINLNRVELKISLEFGAVGNRSMQVKILTDNTVSIVEPKSPGIHEVALEILLPTSVRLFFSGKDSTDDLYVRVNQIWLDNMEPSVDLSRILCLKTGNGDEFWSDHIGVNGEMTIDLLADDVFGQIMGWNRQNYGQKEVDH